MPAVEPTPPPPATGMASVPTSFPPNLFLSPLAGYTNLPCGWPCGTRRVRWATTDLVNARALVERNPRALQLIRTSPADRPLAVQLFGSVPDEIARGRGPDRSARPRLDRCQHGLSRAQGHQDRRRLGNDDGAQQDGKKKPGPQHGRGGENPRHGKIAAWLDSENLTAPELARALEDAGVPRSSSTTHARPGLPAPSALRASAPWLRPCRVFRWSVMATSLTPRLQKKC